MKRYRVCFLGTPEFAEEHLRALLDCDYYELVGVVTQPDRPAGRKMQLTPSAVKKTAIEKNLKVLTPENLRHDHEAFAEIKSWQADVAVVVAFGQILSQEFLDSFPFGAVNVHGSLLPRWRGAAPIQRALEAGDRETGVSLQKMIKKLDAGPIIGERRVTLDLKINAIELYQSLANLGCELLRKDLLSYLSGEISLKDQDESQVSIAKKIDKNESELHWDQPALSLHNRIRAFAMGPGCYVMFNGKRLKIHKTLVREEDSSLKPGQVAELGTEGLSVQTAKGQLVLVELQPESKARMPMSEFIKSHPLKKGDMLV